MSDLISRQDALSAVRKICKMCGAYKKYRGIMCGSCILNGIEESIRDIEPKDTNRVVLCKDCKHRPTKPATYRNGFDLDFHSDYKCPCQCDDGYYSWYPDDNWYCANGERKERIREHE